MTVERKVVEIRRADAIGVGIEEPPRAKLIDCATALAFSLSTGGLPPEHAKLWERLLCDHLMIARALTEFPCPLSDAASAHREWRRLRERAQAGDRHRRTSIRAERQWRLMRALECCEAGLKSLLLGRYDEAFTHCVEAWDWAAPGIEAAVRMRKGRAYRVDGLDQEFPQTVARVYEFQLSKAREQLAAERPKLDSTTLQRLVDKRARNAARSQLKLPGEAGRKKFNRALARASKMKAEN